MLSLPFSSHFFVATSNELGLRKRTVSDSQLSASSSLEDNEAPGRPEHAFFDNNQGSWCSYTNGANEWLELDLGTDQTVYGVAVQGSHDSNAEVTLYKIGVRLDGSLGDSWLHEAVSNSHLLVLERVKDSISSVFFIWNKKVDISVFVCRPRMDLWITSIQTVTLHVMCDSQWYTQKRPPAWEWAY